MSPEQCTMAMSTLTQTHINKSPVNKVKIL